MKHNISPATSQDEVERLFEKMARFGAFGEQNAIKEPALTKRLNMIETQQGNGEGSRLRRIVHAAPAFGIPLVATNKGYFIAIRYDELTKTADNLRKRSNALYKRALHLESIGPYQQRKVA